MNIEKAIDLILSNLDKLTSCQKVQLVCLIKTSVEHWESFENEALDELFNKDINAYGKVHEALQEKGMFRLH